MNDQTSYACEIKRTQEFKANYKSVNFIMRSDVQQNCTVAAEN